MARSRLRLPLSLCTLTATLLIWGCATVPADAEPDPDGGDPAFPNRDALYAPLTEDYADAGDLIAAIENNETLKPEYDREKGDDTEWRTLYQRQYDFYRTRAVKLIGDLAERYPNRPELEELLLKRFEFATSVWGLEIADEVADYASSYPENEEGIERAYFYLAQGRMQRNFRKPEPIIGALDEFEERYPESELLLELYNSAVSYLRDLPEQEEIRERLIAKFPDSPQANRAQQEQRKQQSIGELFELDFEDRLTGRRITTADLRGKIVVVDFWATWCGPCVSEIPHMKQLYAEWNDRGVEFVGVSLDSDPDTVVDFCREQGVEWPQYCEDGKSWHTALSRKWGINSIPTIFVLDRDGRIYSVNARGRIEQTIRELL
jgi:thiol-disulfide isomerase/thioredoxin